ncbi:MAG: tetratricopeptide repeat protein [Bacteroidales bacterium]|nr:tetratricopeptide repeat protein [Bacteroidales bacterium]
MKNLKKLITYFIVLIVFFACSSPKEKAELKIKELENILFSDENKMIDKAKAYELIKAYTDFAEKYPDDIRTPEILFKAGDMSMNLSDAVQSIKLFEQIIEQYPDYEKVAQCLFLTGFIYENNLNDLNKAKKIYTEFIEKYPENEFADDAQVSIENLGKTPEQLIKEFEEKTKKNEN